MCRNQFHILCKWLYIQCSTLGLCCTCQRCNFCKWRRLSLFGTSLQSNSSTLSPLLWNMCQLRILTVLMRWDMSNLQRTLSALSLLQHSTYQRCNSHRLSPLLWNMCQLRILTVLTSWYNSSLPCTLSALSRLQHSIDQGYTLSELQCWGSNYLLHTAACLLTIQPHSRCRWSYRLIDQSHLQHSSSQQSIVSGWQVWRSTSLLHRLYKMDWFHTPQVSI